MLTLKKINFLAVGTLLAIFLVVPLYIVSAKQISKNPPLSVNIVSHVKNQEIVLASTTKPFPEYSAYETLRAEIKGGSGTYKTEWQFFAPGAKKDDWQGGINGIYTTSATTSYPFIFHDDGFWKVTVIVTDDKGKTAKETIRLKIVDPRPYETPSLKVTYPNKNTKLKIGSTYNITWTTTGVPESDVMFDHYNMSTNGNANMLISLIDSRGSTQMSEFSPNNGSYSWKVPKTITPGKYKIQVTCQTCGQANNGDGLWDLSDKYFTVKK